MSALDEAGEMTICIKNGESSIQKFGEAVGYTEDDKRSISGSKSAGNNLVELISTVKRPCRAIDVNEISSFDRYIDDVVMNPFYAPSTDAERLLKNPAKADHFRGKLDLECSTVWADALQ